MSTILIADADPGMRYFLSQILSGSGYRIIEATDGSEALALLRAEPSDIDLLLADMNLPGSAELTEAMRAETLGIKVLFVQKPFTVTDMLLEVERLLPRRSGTGA